MNRWHRILVRVLVVAQLLSAAPFASAQLASGGAGAMPCAEMMEMPAVAADADECPCCPDGTDSLRDCLTSCTLAALAMPDAHLLVRAVQPSLRVDDAPASPLVSLSDPPLKPPPIR